MLKMSTKSTYAVRALIHLARNRSEQPENLHRIADEQRIPLPYLEQIFSKLKKAGIVKAVRGPHGGFLLEKSPDAINLAQVISALEGPFEPVLCSFPENRSEDCHEVDGCTSRLLCHELDGALLQVLTSKTLRALSEARVTLHTPETAAVKFHEG